MHTVTAARAIADAAGRGAAAPSRASPSPAPPATPGRNCCALLARHPAVALTAAMSSGAASAGAAAAGAARLWDGAITPLDRRRAGARGRRRVPGAARHGGRRARAGAGRRRRPRHRSVGRVPAARRGDARARWYPETHALPGGRGLRPDRARARRPCAARGWSPTRAAIRPPRCSRSRRWSTPALLVAGRRHHRRRQVGRVGRRQDADRADALLRSARQPVGLRRVRPPPRRRDRAGARPRRSPSRRTWCRSTAASWRRSTCACRPARPRRRSADVYRAGLRRRDLRPAGRRRRCRRSSTSRTRTSATSAGASIRRAARSSCR